jgi:uncharacterized protein (DUF2225 family)
MKHTHNFVENYRGAGAFGMDRASDEETIIFYLQKFSDDVLMEKLVKRMTNEELNEIYSLTSRILKTHLKEDEYHRLFLKDGHHGR